ncbi:Cof-type HAD-IIB family hydrolase [Microbacterium sp. Leaf151]|uniref:Cof-type HAD-IIB family hydrolase n=1 Tax=Microbacterium sp. Leaf151 TaxID=1736276 RepID=UPI0006F9A2F2|nr:Cof-type HAD-IIB family hydrolase [Microbacterium sp. Leaf151]KQR23107.1 HAD family hydrolase [Microbacterium sp. Leaf151]
MDAVTHDIRLVAVDMDGTLLDGDGNVPEPLWELLPRLADRGVAFVPASGRQLATLRATFGEAADAMTFIAENGAYVVRAGVEVASDALDAQVVERAVRRLRSLAAEGYDLGVVLCGKRSAYIERTDVAFRVQASTYYAALEEVDDVLAVDDDVLKIAVCDFAEAAHSVGRALDDIAATRRVVVSSPHWVDIMNLGVDKGAALRRLQAALAVTPAQTAAFGDYLNDLEMMDAADWSYAMANAHPEVVARARHRAPSNTDHGVPTTLAELFPES